MWAHESDSWRKQIVDRFDNFHSSMSNINVPSREENNIENIIFYLIIPVDDDRQIPVVVGWSISLFTMIIYR